MYVYVPTYLPTYLLTYMNRHLLVSFGKFIASVIPKYFLVAK